jgi:CMP-N,N'-diacetyllegionaminic acid synthase
MLNSLNPWRQFSVRTVKICSIIPARGGSKGIPHKNITLVCGKPLISYSIEHSLASKYIDRTIVSTDDRTIANVAARYGAEVPFVRPPEIAQDDSPDYPVFHHALQWLLDNQSYVPDMIVHLRPTSPVRDPRMIDQAIEILKRDKGADCIRTVCEPHNSPYRMWKKMGDRIVPFMDTKYYIPSPVPRQSLPKVYWQTASIDVIRYATIMEKRSMVGDNVIPLVVEDRIFNIDIDTKFDIHVAEIALNLLERYRNR